MLFCIFRIYFVITYTGYICLNGPFLNLLIFLLFLLEHRTCVFNMLQVINPGDRILTAANDFILYHRYDILMLSLVLFRGKRGF